MRSWRGQHRHDDVTPKPLWNGEAGGVNAPPPLPPAPLVVIQAAPKPRLEINERPRRDLRLLIDLIGQRAVERELNVHRTTVRRWLSGEVRIGGAQLQAVRTLLGDLPGTDAAWHGWRFHGGELLSPGGDRYTAGEVLSLRIQIQRAQEQDREIRALRKRIKILEKTVDLYGPAANESDKHSLQVTAPRT